MALKLRSELLIALGLLGAVPLLLVSTFLIWQSHQTLYDEVTSSQQVVADLGALEAEVFLRSLEENLALLAGTIDISNASPDEIERVLNRLIAHSDSFSEVAFLGPDGVERSRVSRTAPAISLLLRDRSEESAVQRALDSGAVTAGRVTVDGLTGQPTITISAPILDGASGMPVGLLTATSQLIPLWERVTEISVRDGTDVFIIDSRNRVIAHPDASVVLRGVTFVPPATEGTSIGLDGESAVTAVAGFSVGGQRFALIAETPASAAFAPVERTMWITIASVALAIVAATAIAVVTVHRIVSPIERLADRARQVRNGDLNPPDQKLEGPAELRTLSITFDEMIDSLRVRQVDLARRGAELNTMNQQLRRAVDEAARHAESEHEAAVILTQREQRLNQILDTAADAIINISERGTIEAFNLAAEQMFGYSSSEVIGESVEILMPRSTALDHQRSVDHYVETGHATSVVGQVRADIARTRDGQEFPIELSVSEMHDPTGRSFTGIIRDMTEIRNAESELAAQVEEAQFLAEAANEAVAAKAHFLATMSHEIRTPMNGVIGMTGLLLGTDLTEEQRQYASTIRSSGDALLTLINDILDFSKIEAGKVELEAIPFSLRDTMYEIAELLSHREDSKSIDLVVQYPTSIPHQVIGDTGRVRQMLLNLGSNAMKFTTSGQVVFAVEDAGEQEDGARRLKLSVADSGIGIPPDRLEAIFDEFTQVDVSTTRTHGGTGLGLAIVRKLVNRMEGTVVAESVEGEGSTFTLEIPFTLDTRTEEPQPPAALAAARVLVISSSELTRQVLADQLSAWRIDAGVATDLDDAARAIERSSEHPFDIAICDCDDVNALRPKLERMRSTCPAFDDIKLVLSVASDSRSTVGEIADVAAVTSRPTPPSRLMNALATALGLETAHRRPEIDADTFQVQAGVKVLVAEDNTVNQIVARKMLEHLGCEVDIVANGVEAVAAVADIPYDLVFMDCQMPEMDGYDATRAIRNGAIRAAIPIVAMTANAMEGDRERCLEAGMDDYVTKPVTAKILPQVLTRWLELPDEQVA